MRPRPGKCPICFSPRVRVVQGPLEFEYKGRKVKVLDVEYEKCLACGEMTTDYDESKHIDSVVLGNAEERRKSCRVAASKTVRRDL
ncbi:MAG: YgiT-type zinc finger protein [Elusimicrobia bacterium]|nr:YgiT-type zinc finger protein [Elusimicrobiota bacterium]